MRKATSPTVTERRRTPPSISACFQRSASARLPCLQTGAIGGPADPCSYKLHHLTPEEVTIFKGGQVTFQIHGGGHAFAIYEVSKDTTRDELGQFLCAGIDPSTSPTQAFTCAISAPPMPTGTT